MRPTQAGFKAHAGRGIGRYADNIARGLARVDETGGLEFCPFSTETLHRGPFAGFFSKNLPCGHVTFETQFVLPKQLENLDVDFVHFFFHGDAPSRLKVPYLLSVLDLIPLRFPDLYKAGRRNLRFHFARFLESQAIRRAAGFLTISHASKRDIVELLNIQEDDVFVTHLGVSPSFTPGVLDEDQRQKRARDLRQQHKIPPERPVLLYVGGIDPRKNVEFLLEILAGLLSDAQQSRPVLAMVGAYERDRCFSSFQSKLKELGLDHDVCLLGFVPDEQLPEIYQLADAFVFPSLYEGFGLPPLEAMASGLPVVAGNNSSLPEVVGSAGLLVPDRDDLAWGRAIRSVLEDVELRKDLRGCGLKQATQFTWESSVEKTMQAYHYFRKRHCTS